MYKILAVVGWYWTAFVALFLAIRLIPWKKRVSKGFEVVHHENKL